MSKIISMSSYRKEKNYRDRLTGMSKVELLEEAINFKCEIERTPDSAKLVIKGRNLMNVLGKRAMSKELQDFARVMESHLSMISSLKVQ